MWMFVDLRNCTTHQNTVTDQVQPLIATVFPDSTHPNLITLQLVDVLEEVRAMEAPSWIRLGFDPSKHGCRTSGGIWHQGTGCRSLEGCRLFPALMLDQIGNWAIRWSAQCLQPFLSIYLIGSWLGLS